MYCMSMAGSLINYPITIFDKEVYVYGGGRSHENAAHNSHTIGICIQSDTKLYEAFLRGWIIPPRSQSNSNMMDEKEIAFFRLVGLVPGLSAWGTLFRALMESILDTNFHQAIMFSAQQQSAVTSRPHWERTIFTSPGTVGLLDFRLAQEDVNMLIENGKVGVKAFMKRTTWDEGS
jgi:hypothetical protein